MTSRLCLALYWKKNNWYSYAPLISASRKKYPDIEVEILRENFRNGIKKLSREYELVFFLFSLMTTDISHVHPILRELLQLRDSIKNILFIAGGSHPTGDPQSTLDLGFDVVVIGEGETTIQDIIERKVNNQTINNVPGTLSRHNATKEPCRGSQRKQIDLNEFLPYSPSNPPLFPPIEISRGCSSACKYCQVPYIYRGVRYRDVPIIEKIVQAVYKQYAHQRSVDIRFISSNSLGYKAVKGKPNIRALEELVKTIKKHPVRLFFGTFPSECRPEYITQEVIERVLGYSDSRKIAIGIQSGSEEMLIRMRRGHTVQQGWNAISLLADSGFIPVVDFLIGCPTETIKDQQHTMELIHTLVREKKCIVRMHHFMPLPGSPWGKMKPVPIDDTILHQIGDLARRRKLTGSFTLQKERAEIR